jgi:hypothetical protein
MKTPGRDGHRCPGLRHQRHRAIPDLQLTGKDWALQVF